MAKAKHDINTLAAATGLSSAVILKARRCAPIATSTVAAICNALYCTAGEIKYTNQGMPIVPPKKEIK